MKIKRLVIIISILILTSGFSLTSFSILANENIIYVDDDGGADYTSIQEAIDAASSGYTIFVYSGRYNENIVIDKTIILIGENKDTTIINSSEDNNIINITADNVELTGFTVEICGGYSLYSGIDIQANSTNIYNNKLTMRDLYYYPNGIYINSNKINNQIHENIFLKTGFGLDTNNIGDNTIINNTVNDNSLIYLDTISDQIIESAGQIILKNCNNITIENLEIQNTPGSIVFIKSNNCIVKDCTIQNNDKGIVCTDSFSIKIINNVINENNQGIYISNSESILITRNDVHYNSGALYVDTCKKINTTLNNFYSNGFCINIYISNLNIIKQNNFGNNFRNVHSIYCSLNTFDNNFWNRPRIFPKIIIELPRINIDWNPAQNPFTI
jgi:parallel beta-helix repeat protein